MEKQKFKNKKLTKVKVVNNLQRYYNLSNSDVINNGLNWYKEAYNFALKLSNECNEDLYKVCGVIAALSPQTSWQRNKEIAYLFLVKKQNTGLQNSAQINKAFQCLSAETPEQIYNLLTKKGLKSSQFFYNIYYYNINKSVTIDRHAISACIFRPNNIEHLETQLTVKQYEFFSDCYKNLADKLGLLYHELQAIIWITFRDLKELPKEYQLTEIECPF